MQVPYQKFFPKYMGEKGWQTNSFFRLTLIETYYLSKNLLYPEHFQPSWPEGFLPFPPVIWLSSIPDI
jgi:hypothetical protein